MIVFVYNDPNMFYKLYLLGKQLCSKIKKCYDGAECTEGEVGTVKCECPSNFYFKSTKCEGKQKLVGNWFINLYTNILKGILWILKI